MSRYKTGYHMDQQTDRMRVRALGEDCYTLNLCADGSHFADVMVFAPPAQMVELLSDALTQAQTLLDAEDAD